MTTRATRGAVTYSRNSSAKQKSIAEQRDLNRAACAEQGWPLIAELSDPVSASRYSTRVRENWTRLLELLPAVDVVVLWEPSRGDRRLATWVAFLDACREHGVLIHAVTHRRTYDPRNARDYRSLAEDGVDSAHESDKISERTRRGLAGAMAAGHPHGSLAYGYRRRYDERGEFAEQVPDAETAPVVRGVFDAVAVGTPVQRVARDLGDRGVPTPRGGRVWYASTLAGILRNPSYRPHPDDPARGCLVHEGRLVGPGAWPPLVTEQVWRAVQQVIGADDEAVRQRRRDSAPGQVKYLLSGNADVMACGVCGSLLTGWSDRAGRGASYACRERKCVSAPMRECDEYVTRLVVARLSRKDARHLWVEDDTARLAATDELARLRDELDEARRSFAAVGGISATALAMKEQALAPAIADAERRARPAGAPLAALRLIDAASMGRDRVRPTWDDLPLPAQRETIAGIFASLTLGPITTRIGRWSPPEERLAIVAERIEHDWRKP